MFFERTLPFEATRVSPGPGVALGLLLTMSALFPRAANGTTDGAWKRLTPPPRTTTAVAYDGVHRRLIAFGGTDGNLVRNQRNDVWVMSLAEPTTWSKLQTAGTPPSYRDRLAAIYDPVRNRYLLFGGVAPPTPGFFDETWVLTLDGTPTWSKLTTSGPAPPGRSDHTAAYDPVRDRMIIAGGSGVNGDLGDAWAISLSGTPVWTSLGSGPFLRNRLSSVYDSSRDRIVFFSGSDTWSLDLATTTWQTLSPLGSPPAPRTGHAAIYDPVRDRMVVFGGDGNGLSFTDTWALSFSGAPSWAPLAPAGSAPSPPARWVGFCDPSGDRMLVYGGNQTWSMTLGSASAWSRISPPPPTPAIRFGASVIYDSARDRWLFFGGQSFTAVNETWSLTLVSGIPHWELLAPGGTPPPPCYDHSAIYDPSRDRMVVYGTPASTMLDNRVWQLSLAGATSWSELPTSGAPPGRTWHSAIYDPIGDRMIIYGGRNLVVLDETWVLSFAGTPTWSRLGGPGPPARYGQSAVYDPVRRRMLVFGGLVFGGSSFNDLWALPLAPLAPWQHLTPVGPSARGAHSAVYDPVRDRMLVFGGSQHPDYYPPMNDLWALDLGTQIWSSVTPDGDPPLPRFGHVAAYDPLRDLMILFGGSTEFVTDQADLWEWLPPSSPTPVAISLAQVDAQPGRVSIRWWAPIAGLAATVERCTQAEPWMPIALIAADGTGMLSCEDRDVLPGQLYKYRLALAEQAGIGYAGETSVHVPLAPGLSLVVAPNPTHGEIVLSIHLPEVAPARIELLDLSGRRLDSRELMGLGSMEIRLGAPRRLLPGIYWLHLAQSGHTIVRRVAVVR